MTKKPIVTLTLVSISLLASSFSAQAADSRSKKSPPPAATESRSFVSEPQSYSSSGSTKFAFGYATGLGTGVLGASSAAALIMLPSGGIIDVRLAIPSTSPFNFGIGGLYKHTLATSQNAGFHIGGGIAFGSIDPGTGGNFAMTIAGLAGFHFTLPGVSAIQLHLDGGPSFTLVSSSPSVTSFAISGLSPALGLAAFYTF